MPNEIACLNLGFVALMDTMGDDETPANTARTSYRNRVERTPEENVKLTRYLMKHRHTTPFEFCQARFYMKLPLFVSAQMVRHRTASINQISFRYVQATREFYIPELDECLKQSKANKQGASEEVVDYPKLVREEIEASCNRSFDAYENLIAHGLANELARCVLPTGTYTEWVWQCDLHNIMHLLGLRADSHAQKQIRVYAEAMLALLQPVFPTILDAWKESLISP